MTEKDTQLEAGLASDLNRELDALLPLAAKALGRELGTDGDFYILKQKSHWLKMATATNGIVLSHILKIMMQ